VRAGDPADNAVSAALVWGFDHVIEDNAEPIVREHRQTFCFDRFGDKAWAQSTAPSACVPQ
jgi:hypothetical protein